MCARPLLCAVAVAVLLTAGCRNLCPPRSPALQTGCGEVRLHWPACRALRVVEHRVRRDRRNRLVVRVQFETRGDSRFPGRLAVSFYDEGGQVEPTPVDTGRHVFPPGRSGAVEWTSYSDDAVRYEIEVSGGGLLP